jgi:hypothetical protein
VCILKNTKDPPKNGQKSAKNGLKQDTPILGHDSDFVGGEYSKHPPKNDHPCFRKRRSHGSHPSFAKYSRDLRPTA